MDQPTLPHSTLTLTDMALRLLTAALCGAALGFDREARGKAAGLRTHMLVALSSAAATLVAFRMLAESGSTGGDPTRVIQGIAQAVGFIGAGIVIRAGGAVHGVTSAALIWLAGALGMACGGGYYSVAVLTLAIALAVLIGLRPLERRFF